MSQAVESKNQLNPVVDWVFRLVKGILIGIGFITPGLSGGVIAVVLGVYEQLMKFLANIRVAFLKNFVYFIPIGIGGIIGVIAFSAAVDWAYKHYQAQFIWLCIGFIVGTLPSLIKTAGKEGRLVYHWVIMAALAIATYFLMSWLEGGKSITLAQNFWSWVLSGALIGIGVVVPGMSPSNFLIYLGLYQPMAAGIKDLNFGVILPLMLGGLLALVLLVKLVAWLFNRHYAVMYHIILGIVLGSTLAIIPRGVSGIETIIACAVLFLLGAAASYGLSKLDEKFPHEAII